MANIVRFRRKSKQPYSINYIFTHCCVGLRSCLADVMLYGKGLLCLQPAVTTKPSPGHLAGRLIPPPTARRHLQVPLTFLTPVSR